jgi:DNA-binding PadR family transcriptional regulator
MHESVAAEDQVCLREVVSRDVRGDESPIRRRVAQPAVFIALSRLEKKGLVTSRLDEGDGGRTRRYFKLTRQGLALVKQTRIEHARLWRGLGRLLGSREV